MEIRFGMKLLLNKRLAKAEKKGQHAVDKLKQEFTPSRHVQYVKVTNARFCSSKEETHLWAAKKNERDEGVITLDGETLTPTTGEHFSPFMATALLPRNVMQFQHHQAARRLAVDTFWPVLSKLPTHFAREQWHLFDKEIRGIGYEDPLLTEADRIKAMFTYTEMYGKLFSRNRQQIEPRIRQRIALSENTSASLVRDLVAYFVQQKKDESINRELMAVRNQWSQCYGFLAPIYVCQYWDDIKNTLDAFTIVQKRFADLKPLYVESFETFCRISVIAAGLEGVIHRSAVGVPIKTRTMSLQDFDGTPNGAKPDILKQLVIADMFVPFIDHDLRNGIGHHSAHYDAKKDSIEYATQNRTARKEFSISYIRFCEKVARLYAQIEDVSIYAHWLREKSLGM